MAKEFLRNSLARNFLEIPWEFLGPQIPFLEVSLTKDHDFNQFLKFKIFSFSFAMVTEAIAGSSAGSTGS